MGSSGKGSKTSQASNQSHSKAPPVPTLVRGAGSNLAGKKPTFMPEEVVKVRCGLYKFYKILAFG